MKMLILAIGVASAAAASRAPRQPLVNRLERPAVGNIGQRGRPRLVPAAIGVPQKRVPPPERITLPPRPAVEAQRPLVTPEKRPAVGNVMCKCEPEDCCR